ncbi:uncharacterized protein C2orf78 homolog isoform X2 [Anolis carolinensis]
MSHPLESLRSQGAFRNFGRLQYSTRATPYPIQPSHFQEGMGLILYPQPPLPHIPLPEGYSSLRRLLFPHIPTNSMTSLLEQEEPNPPQRPHPPLSPPPPPPPPPSPPPPPPPPPLSTTTTTTTTTTTMKVEDFKASISSSQNLSSGSDGEKQKKWDKKLDENLGRKRKLISNGETSEGVPCKKDGQGKNREAKPTSADADKPAPKSNLAQQMLESIQVFHPLGKKFPIIPAKTTLPDKRPSGGVSEQLVSAMGRGCGKVFPQIPQASTSTTTSAARPSGYFMPQPESLKMKPHQVKETAPEFLFSHPAMRLPQCRPSYVPTAARQVLQSNLPPSQPPQISRGRGAFSRATVIPPKTTPAVEKIWRPPNRLNPPSPPYIGDTFIPWSTPDPTMEVSRPITEEQRPIREWMKHLEQKAREEAACWTKLGRVRFFAQREKDLRFSNYYGYPDKNFKD